MLETHGPTPHYGGSQILNGIYFASKAGGVSFILGPNGPEKTSCLKAGRGISSGINVTLNGEV